MLLKNREWEKCKECGAHKKLISEDVYGCDYCKKVIDLNKKQEDWLEITIFYHDEEEKHLQLCSWKCVLKILPTLKTDYFISLPYLSYDRKNSRVKPSEFFRLIKKR